MRRCEPCLDEQSSNDSLLTNKFGAQKAHKILMKLTSFSAVCIAVAPSVTNAYRVGFGLTGRPLVIQRNRPTVGICSGPSCTEDGFDTLRNEFGGRRRRRRFSDSTSLDRLQKAFEIAADFMDDSTKTQDLVDQAFGAVNDWSTSPRYQISTEEDGSRVLTIDVPGMEDLDVSVNKDEQSITITGKRTIGRGENSRVSEFTKTFTLSDESLVDEITAKLSNGVLTVTVPQKKEEPVDKEDSVQKIKIETVPDVDSNEEHIPVETSAVETPEQESDASDSVED